MPSDDEGQTWWP